VRHRDPPPGGLLGDVPRACRVHGLGGRTLGLGTVDRGVGRGVDHPVRARHLEHACDLRTIGDVDVGDVERDDRRTIRRGRTEIRTEHSRRAEDENSHSHAVPWCRRHVT
jgi:hypothetical protein